MDQNTTPALFFKILFYLFIETDRERERERERQRHRQREKQAPHREPDMGLDPRSPGSHPGLQAVLNRCATGLPTTPAFNACLFYWRR